jgi:hypothetical protein
MLNFYNKMTIAKTRFAREIISKISTILILGKVLEK